MGQSPARRLCCWRLPATVEILCTVPLAAVIESLFTLSCELDL